MKRKVSLKLSSATKGPGLARLGQRKKGHHLADCKGITWGWIRTIKPTIDTERPNSNLGGWTVFTVTAPVALSSRLCVFCSLPSHRGFCHIIRGLEGLRGSRLYRKWCVTVQNPSMQRGCQGTKIEQAFILQTNVQLNLTLCFCFHSVYFFVSWNFHATNDQLITCYISVDFTITDI